jgi:hypothetical protein
LKVYGSVGDDAKLEYLLKDLEFDGGFNYKKDAPKDILPKLIPQGIGIPLHIPLDTSKKRLIGEISTLKMWVERLLTQSSSAQINSVASSHVG